MTLACATVDSGMSDLPTTTGYWDALGARILQSSHNDITQLLHIIKNQHKEITRLQELLREADLERAASHNPNNTASPPALQSASAAAASSADAVQVTSSADEASHIPPTDVRPLVDRAADVSDERAVGPIGVKRGIEDISAAVDDEPAHRGKKSKVDSADENEMSDASPSTAATRSPASPASDSDSITQPLPTFVVNILPPSPVKAHNAQSAPVYRASPHQPAHNAETQPLEPDTDALQQHQHTYHPQQQPLPPPPPPPHPSTAADHLFDELTQQEAADATARQRRLHAQTLARTAFNLMRQHSYTAALQHLTAALALLPPSNTAAPPYPASLLRARLTCHAKLGRRQEAAEDAEALWAGWPGSLAAYVRGVVECRAGRWARAVAWLREAEWRKRQEEAEAAARAAEAAGAVGGGVVVEVASVEDEWDVTAEEREMRTVSLHCIRDNLGKVEQRMASEARAKEAAVAIKQEQGKQQVQVQQEQAQPRVSVVDEKGKGGKRVTFVAPQTQPSLDDAAPVT